MEDTGRREPNSKRGAKNIRARRAERTREQILQAGLKVFSAKGFEGATMDDIALELEATKGLLYYHFKTKEEILSAILKNSPVIAALESTLSTVEYKPFAEAVRTATEGAGYDVILTTASAAKAYPSTLRNLMVSRSRLRSTHMIEVMHANSVIGTATRNQRYLIRLSSVLMSGTMKESSE